MITAIPNCPLGHGPMRERNSARGKFYGCSRFPDCKQTVDAVKAPAVPAQRGPASPVAHGAARIKAKFPGACDGCGAAVKVGDLILYADRRTQGCPACATGGGNNAAASTPIKDDGKPVGQLWAHLIKDDNAMGVGAICAVDPGIMAAVPPCPFPLDEYQRAVVAYDEPREAIVAAGAGSGKSTVLRERVVELLRQGVAPEAIVVLVYNRDAAEKFREALKLRTGEALAKRITAETFHAWAWRNVRSWWPTTFKTGSIVNSENGPSSNTLALSVLRGHGDTFQGFEARDLVRVSEFAREQLIDLDADDAAEWFQSLPTRPSRPVAEKLALFARAYQRVKAQRGAIDFADMLTLVSQVIKHGGIKARQLATRYARVMVDEAQDGNPVRWFIATHLGGAAAPFEMAPRLVSVGDLRQSIYSFSGATPALFRQRIEKGAKLLTLPVNRRSVRTVVEAGNKVADGRDWNLGGACIPANPESDVEAVRIWRTRTPGDEAEAVVKEVLARINAGTPLVDEKSRPNYACLVRTNAQAASLECAFLARNVPVRVVGADGGVWNTKPGRDVRAYLAGAEGIATEDLAVIANKPSRFLKRQVIEDVVAAVTQEANELGAAGYAGETRGLLATALRQTRNTGAIRFARDLDGLAALDWKERCEVVLQFLLDDLAERSDMAGTGSDEDKEAAYRSLIEIAVSLGSLKAIEAQVEAMKRVGATEPAVEICTIHRSKGLEWRVVFVCGVAEGALPHMKSTDVEEERRLFYVALTRAKEILIVSIGGQDPSPFLEALGLDVELEKLTARSSMVVEKLSKVGLSPAVADLVGNDEDAPCEGRDDKEGA